MERKLNDFLKLSISNLYKCDGIIYLIGDGLYSHLNSNFNSRYYNNTELNSTSNNSKNLVNLNLLKMIFSLKKNYFIFNTVKDGILKEEFNKSYPKIEFSNSLIEINGNVNDKQCFKCRKIVTNKLENNSINLKFDKCMVCNGDLRTNIDIDENNSFLKFTLNSAGLLNSSDYKNGKSALDFEFVNKKIIDEIENNFFNFLNNNKKLGVIEIGIESNSRPISKVTENMFFTSTNNKYKSEDNFDLDDYRDEFKVNCYLRINSKCTSEVTDFLRTKSKNDISKFENLDFDIDEYLENIYKNSMNNLRNQIELKQSNPIDLGFQRTIQVLKEIRVREKKDFELSFGSFLNIRNHPFNVINIINDLF